MTMLVNEGNLWRDFGFNLVDILRYSGHFVGYSKIFKVFSNFLVDNILSQCFRCPTLRMGRCVG